VHDEIVQAPRKKMSFLEVRRDERVKLFRA
jgi:hypothetical protein